MTEERLLMANGLWKKPYSIPKPILCDKDLTERANGNGQLIIIP